MTPLHSARHPRLAPPHRRPPLWPKSSHPRSHQWCLPTLCPTARLPACPWAPPPRARSRRPPSRGCLNPPFPTVGLTRQPSRDPGLPRATPGRHTGAHRPSLAIPWPLVVPLALGTPWRGAGTPVLVILSSPPTSRQEENLPTQRSPSSRASQAPPSPPTRPGLPLPMGFLHLRVLPGPGIRRCPGPRPFPTSTCTTTFGPPTAEIRG